MREFKDSVTGKDDDDDEETPTELEAGEPPQPADAADPDRGSGRGRAAHLAVRRGHVATAIRPVGHEDRLSARRASRRAAQPPDHPASSRSSPPSRSALAFNHQILTIINKPLQETTQKRTAGREGDPLGQVYAAHQDDAGEPGVDGRDLQGDRAADSTPGAAGLRSAKQLARRPQQRRDSLVLPNGAQPVTLGAGEPFPATFTVASYFALLLSLPIILYQLYAFLLPAFSPEERQVATPLMMMIPVLFIAGVLFGYFLVLPAAVRFLQNFNATSSTSCCRRKDYYKFAVLTLVASGLVFQVPVAVLALTGSAWSRRSS